MKLFEYLSSVKKRPGMYMSGEAPLNELELQIHGFLAAVSLYGISEDALEFNSKLNKYISKRYRWSTSCGWADAIARNTENTEQAVDLFFEIANGFIEQEYGAINAIDESYVR